MDIKLQKISELAAQTAQQITKNPQEWAKFLRTSAWLYKYSFQDQLFIYAQRPDATACAPIQTWNKRMNRWINAGSKGIALITGSGENPHLRYVFDISDTHGAKGSRAIKLWKMQPQNIRTVLQNLEDTFGAAHSPYNDNVSLLMDAVANAVRQGYLETLDELLLSREDSMLEELDELNVNVRLLNTLITSVQYSTLTRCGIDAGEYITDDDLRGIVDFNTIFTLSCLGNAHTKMTESVLRQVEHTVKQIARKSIQPLENQKTLAYNEISALKRETAIEEGAFDDIHKERGLSDSKSGDGQTTDRGNREIRETSGNIPEGTPQRIVHESDAPGQTQGASYGNRPDSEPAHEANGQGNGSTSRSERRVESIRSDALGAGNEQPDSVGRGNSPERFDLQLNNEDNTTADEESVVFHFFR